MERKGSFVFDNRIILPRDKSLRTKKVEKKEIYVAGDSDATKTGEKRQLEIATTE
jgi:hypothetical protein